MYYSYCSQALIVWDTNTCKRGTLLINEFYNTYYWFICASMTLYLSDTVSYTPFEVLHICQKKSLPRKNVINMN